MLPNIRKQIFRLLLLSIACTALFDLKSQDLVINWRGDSLDCKVIKMNDKLVVYRLLEEDSIETTFTVPKSMISVVTKNHFPKTTTPPIHERTDGSSPRVRMLVRTGLGNQMGAQQHDNKQVEEHYGGLGVGLVFGAECTIETPMKIDLGFSYSIFRTANTTNDILMRDDDSGEEFKVDWKDARTMQFVGPKLAYMLGLKETGNVLEFSLCPGALFYVNRSQRDESISQLGKTIAVQLGADHDLMLNERMGVAFNARLLLGKLKRVETVEGDLRLGQLINLPVTRSEFGIGLAWYVENKAQKAVPRF
jgi:hypothetical protein